MGNQESHFSEIAVESIAVFEEISNKAKERISGSSPLAAASMAVVNTFTDGDAVQRVGDIQASELAGLRALCRTPAIARVVARDEGGEVHVYYISDQTSILLDHSRQHASYRSPVGRLAALPPGEELEIRIDGNRRTLEVLEIARYRPSRDSDVWDSKPITFEGFEFDVLSYPSLRSLLRDELPSDAEDALEAILGGAVVPERIDGIRHEIRSAMALREQPILDRFQDEIFRLPIDSKLMILGPPGTGKTTTLIKRLGQKLDRAFLSAEEEKVVAAMDSAQWSYVRSWLMFTPTDLLKHYVKEAFNREQIAASDEHIRTWGSMRMELARQVLGILQSATNKGKFILKEQLSLLTPEVIGDPIPWYEDFQSFHAERILDQLKSGTAMLEAVRDVRSPELVSRIIELMNNAEAAGLSQLFEALDKLEEVIQPIVRELKIANDGAIKSQLVLTFNKDRGFLDALARFLDSLQVEEEEGPEDEAFDDEPQDDQPEQTSAQKAAVAYTSFIRSIARYRFQGRAVPRNSRTRVLLDWLGDRVPDEQTLVTIGKEISLQNALRRFINSHQRFVMDAPASYRAFRKQRAGEGRWYDRPPDTPGHISPGELDGITLLMLQSARALHQSSRIGRRLDEPGFQYLKSVTDRFKAQVVVDEATDFSAIQLASMRALAMPRSDSFFACGDFNQRITEWGTSSPHQLQWAIPGMETRKINIVYRQSRRLNAFSHQLLEAFGGDTEVSGKLPDHVIHDGVAPALVESLVDPDEQAIWLFERISEVERMVGEGRMPSIAILVNSETEVGPMAEAMNVMLEDINLQAMAGHDGQALGERSQIRVFDVAHIKGLEFEAVFFVGIDRLEEKLPELFGKYLYVGATRAATYFGGICVSDLPEAIEPLRSEFVDSWGD